MIVYFNGAFMPKDQVCISPDDRGFLFADGVYEVMWAYDGRVFTEDRHFARLAHSLDALHIVMPDLDELRSAGHELLARNGLGVGGARLYLQITRGVANRTHTFPEKPVTPTVYASAEPYAPPKTLWRTGVRTILVPDIRWSRCDIKSLALTPNVLASQRAKEAGAFEAILVRDGAVTEGSHTGLCAVFDGRVVTHPLTHHILGSVTRDVVLSLCDELGIPTLERPILEESLWLADELMLLGTTSGIVPVIEVDECPIGDGTPGPITLHLQSALWARMTGGAQ
jgi:D-alanine transaminase